MVTKVEGYRAEDGRLFESEQDAEMHEREQRWCEGFYNDDCNDGSAVILENLDELRRFLNRNENWIHEMMGWQENARKLDVQEFIKLLGKYRSSLEEGWRAVERGGASGGVYAGNCKAHLTNILNYVFDDE